MAKGRELIKVDPDALATAYALAKTSPGTRTMEKNARARRSIVRRFLEWAEKPPTAVTPQDIADWRSYLEVGGGPKGKPLSKATQYHHISIVSQFFEWLVSQRAVEFNPVPSGKWRNGFRPKPYGSEKVKALTAEDVRAFVREIDRDTVAGARLYAMVKLMLTTGMRAAEVCGIRAKNARLDNGTPTVRSKVKGGEWVTWEITESTRQAILDYLALAGREPKGNAALFASIPRRHKGGKLNEPLTPYYLWSQVKRVAEKAGIQDMTVHRFRHTFAQLYSQEATIPEVQGMLGHKSERTTRGYLGKLAPRPSKAGKTIEAILEGE
jgi:integrase